MGDGFTGYNEGEIKTQLNSFVEAMTGIQADYYTAFTLFNDELHRAWASPNATTFNQIIWDLGWDRYYIGAQANRILTSAVNAAAYMARANGAEFSYDWTKLPESYDIVELEESRDGITGMNIPMCKIALGDFTAACQKVLTALENVPMNFSLLDPAGELQAAYRGMLKEAMDYIEDNLTDATSQMTEAYDSEELKVTLGKQQAETELAA